MLIRYGFDIEMDFPQPTPLLALLNVHPSRRHEIMHEETFFISPAVETTVFIDQFGNHCSRLQAPGGKLALKLEGMIHDSGAPDPVNWSAQETPVSALPPQVLPFLLGSRYCETDLLSEFAWSNFGAIHGGWAKVQAICDFVHQRLVFNYLAASATRTASQALNEGVGVCRDFTHLAVALCRCLNIPARYCNGYLGDIGVPFNPDPMDFNAWFEAYLDGVWYTFDARHNEPRIGRILISRGRDAADTAMINSFGQHVLTRFIVVTDEIANADAACVAQSASVV